MRCTLETDRPEACAINRVLQWVAVAGIVSSVAVTTSVTLSSPILRGAPGRGSSLSPSIRLVANRARQVATVTRVVLNRLAIARFVMPLAASSTIDARIASPRDVFRRRARASSSASSSSLRSMRTAWGPRILASCVLSRTENHGSAKLPRNFRDRTLGTVDGLKRFVTMHESPYHGLNFCQGTVAEMLDDPRH